MSGIDRDGRPMSDVRVKQPRAFIRAWGEATLTLILAMVLLALIILVPFGLFFGLLHYLGPLWGGVASGILFLLGFTAFIAWEETQ